MNIYKAINQVQSDLSKSGLAKNQTNSYDNYKFRGIDDVYNVLSPLLAKHGLCILPRMVSRVCEERVGGGGKALFYVTVEAEFDFVCADDGSKHTVKTYGEAMDRGDKATNKAMSAAYKYACFQTFAIPTEGDNDADAHTETVQPLKITPTSGAWKALDATKQALLIGIATDVTELVSRDQVFEANATIADAELTSEEKVALWTRLDSKTRSALKKANERKAA